MIVWNFNKADLIDPLPDHKIVRFTSALNAHLAGISTSLSPGLPVKAHLSRTLSSLRKKGPDFIHLCGR
jgi:hypothetical protein